MKHEVWYFGATFPPRVEPAVRDAGTAGAARALRAALPERTPLSDAERHLLTEWLDRLAADG
ncbi:hypothetical protein [Streptosporangium sp. NPDC023615]|uniref:hypothetical protein n=1 Tax=Streptosporangium sp. NPDC023615 TaxID=3154794 RepID=UPI003420C7E1